MLEIQTIPKHDANAEGYDATGSALRMIPNSSDLSPVLPSLSYSGLSARFTGQSLILGTHGSLP